MKAKAKCKKLSLKTIMILKGRDIVRMESFSETFCNKS